MNFNIGVLHEFQSKSVFLWKNRRLTFHSFHISANSSCSSGFSSSCIFLLVFALTFLTKVPAFFFFCIDRIWKQSIYCINRSKLLNLESANKKINKNMFSWNYVREIRSNAILASWIVTSHLILFSISSLIITCRYKPSLISS